MTAAAALVVLALGTGCGDRKLLPTEPAVPGPVDPSATFTRVQRELFDVSCALAGCHAGSAPQAGMDLAAGRAYGNIVGVRSTERGDLNRIEPFSPDACYMVKKLRGDPDIIGSPMPLVGSITRAQLDLLENWILRGAPDD